MMHLEAIRLREVGTFREGCALEGIAPGLNLFVGPNELGKSTLFGALRLLFEEAYTANNKIVRRLQPNGGGAPYVECDFVADGRSWRLSKQFLAGRLAVLRERDGRTIYRGGDVEPALTDLLDAALGTKSNMDLLWVAQRQSFEPPKPDGAVRQTLDSLTRSEAEAAVGGGELAAVHARIRDQLFALVTERNRKPKAGGAYMRALEHRDALRERCQAAQDKCEASRQNRTKLIEIEQLINQLEEAARAGIAASRVAELRAELEQAGRAKARLELSQERVERLEGELKDARAQLGRLDGNIAVAAELAERLEDVSGRLATLSDERAAAERTVSDAEQHYADLQRRREVLNNEKVAAERHARRRDLEGQLKQGRDRLREARKVAQGVRDLARDIDAIAIDKSTFDRLSKLRDEIAAVEAQIEVTAGRVRLAYMPGAAGCFQVDGEPLEDDTELVVDHPIRIVVPDLGEIVVTPGGDGSDLAESCAGKRMKFADVLCECGATSYDEVQALWECKRELVGRHASHKALLDNIAPDGLDPLEEAIQGLEAQVAELGDGPAPDEGLAERIAETADELELSARRLQEARETFGILRESQVRQITERDGISARREAVHRELPPDGEARRAQRDELVQKIELAGAKRNAAVRDLDAWREAAPEPERLAALTQELEDCECKMRTDNTRLSQLREERRALESVLQRDLEDGVEADAQTLHAQAEAAQSALDRIETDVAALTLLDHELSAERDDLNRRIAGPVAERVNALVAEVLPQASVEIDSGLEVSRITRVTAAEAIDQLSDGTREQVSVLARLAFAGILAESGHAVPLVLDDALVFSDDERLVKMFALLGVAANHHQVIIMTCHGRSFAPLVAQHGAKPLLLSSADVAMPPA